MAKSNSVKRKTRGRPATGVDPFIGIRLPSDLIKTIEGWAGRHDARSRSDAIRQLVLLGLSTEAERKPKKGTAETRDVKRSHSKQMAGDAMDHEMRHSGASDKVKDERKRRLMKMPGELSTKPTRKTKKAASTKRSERDRAVKRFDNQKGDRS